MMNFLRSSILRRVAGACMLVLLSVGCEAEAPPPPHPGLSNPKLAREQAPETFRVEMKTTQGDVVFEVNRAWAPHGADRFYNLVKVGFFEEIGLIRVIDGFMAQFGLHGEPRIARAWNKDPIPDDPLVESNLKGTLSFAKPPEKDSRTSQLFVNFRDNPNLDQNGFVPIGRLVSGFDVLDKIHRTGEGAPGGPGPSQARIEILGNDYLRETFPDLDYITGARILD